MLPLLLVPIAITIAMTISFPIASHMATNDFQYYYYYYYHHLCIYHHHDCHFIRTSIGQFHYYFYFYFCTSTSTLGEAKQHGSRIGQNRCIGTALSVPLRTSGSGTSSPSYALSS